MRGRKRKIPEDFVPPEWITSDSDSDHGPRQLRWQPEQAQEQHHPLHQQGQEPPHPLPQQGQEPPHPLPQQGQEPPHPQQGQHEIPDEPPEAEQEDEDEVLYDEDVHQEPDDGYFVIEEGIL